MRQGDNVHMVTVWARPASPEYGSRVIEFGARGNAVRLLAVHYSSDFFQANSSAYLSCALSEDPRHEVTPPSTQELFHENAKALYGKYNWIHAQVIDAGAGEAYGVTGMLQTAVIPLYGIIRPRRQIFVYYWLHSTGPQTRLIAEVYYEPVSLDRTTLDTLDRKYGKYRRT